MTEFEANRVAKDRQIGGLMALDGRAGGLLRISKLSEDRIAVEAGIPILVGNADDPASVRLSKGAYMEFWLPAGFPLGAKPLVTFPDSHRRPFSPNIFESGQACIGNFYSDSTLTDLLRKLLLECILDDSAVNPNDAANKKVKAVYPSVCRRFSLPLLPPHLIYTLIPKAGLARDGVSGASGASSRSPGSAGVRAAASHIPARVPGRTH